MAVTKKIPVVAARAKEKYRVAIVASLAKLLESGHKITIESVVANARYPSGEPVGKSTIFAKNLSGSYVHDELRSVIQVAARKQRSSGAVRRVSVEKKLRDRSDSKELKLMLKSLTDQLVEQRFKLLEAESMLGSEVKKNGYLEEQLYVSVLVSNELSRGVVPDFSRVIKNFREKHDADNLLLDRLANSAEGYLSTIRRSKPIGLGSRWRSDS